MAIGKRLKNIAVSHTPGQVGVSLTYDQGPQDHMLLPLSVAKSLHEKLGKAIRESETTGDSVAVSDHVKLKVN